MLLCNARVEGCTPLVAEGFDLAYTHVKLAVCDQLLLSTRSYYSWIPLTLLLSRTRAFSFPALPSESLQQLSLPGQIWQLNVERNGQL